MSTPAKLTAFAAGLAAVFGGAALAGSAIDPSPPGASAAAPGEDSQAMKMGTHTPAAEGSAAHAGAHGAGDHPVRGLAVADNGLRLVVDRAEFTRGATERLSFRIVDTQGKAIRDFDVEHTKRLHLIVARRDLTGFQHLHPRQAADGAWSTPLRLAAAGSYRIFADFSRGGEPVTLASDLRVDGNADLRSLPAPAPAAKSDGGYDVRLVNAAARPGRPAELRFDISKDGHPVHVEPYLGADGHLVALRESDLAYLHVHPSGHTGGAAHDDSVGFEATFPTAGRYRLFLQFKHEGRIQTVAFTQDVR